MQVRQHRGLLADSMKTVVTIEPSMEALAAHISSIYGEPVSVEDITVEPYGNQPDERIGWYTHIVLVKGAPFGFTDGRVSV